MYDYQILALYDSMSNTQLLYLSPSETVSTDQFISLAKSTSKEKGSFLQSCSSKIECSVQELLVLLQDNALLPFPTDNDSSNVAQAKKGRLVAVLYIIVSFFR